MSTFEQFNQQCREQGMLVTPLLGPEGDDEPLFRGRFSKGPAHPLLQAVVRAGILLRENPPRALVRSADTVLDVAAFGDDVPMRTLAAMCNGSIVPGEAGPVPLPGPLSGAKGVCASAESLWIDALEERRGTLRTHSLAEVFTNNGGVGGTVILARKHENEQTTLTFEEVTIGGITYPKGSLLNLRAVGDAPRLQELNLLTMPVGVPVRGIGDVACASFLRLSAFAMPPEQREEYGVATLGENRTIDMLQGEAQAGAALTYLNQLDSA